jgi:hypothetical protein
VTAHLKLVSTTAHPAEGRGDDWTAIEDGARFAQQMVRDAEEAGFCLPCWQTDGRDARHCRGGDCRNVTAA